MRKALWILTLSFLSISCQGPKDLGEVERKVRMVREPVAIVPPYRFYSPFPDVLKAKVRGFLSNVKKEKVKGELIALIAPHAGYDFSGQVAAFAYKQIEGERFDTIILLGGHKGEFSGVSIGNYGAYRTPLGDVPVENEMADKLIEENKEITFYPPAHQEHGLEVQLPFLQETLKDFKILPIKVVGIPLDGCRKLGDILAREIKGKRVLLVGSTDFSHDYSYEMACKIDRAILRAIESLDEEEVFRRAPTSRELCGRWGVATTLVLAKRLGADRVRVLKYANSGDVMEDRFSRIVGYAAIAIYSGR